MATFRSDLTVITVSKISPLPVRASLTLRKHRRRALIAFSAPVDGVKFFLHTISARASDGRRCQKISVGVVSGLARLAYGFSYLQVCLLP